MGVSDSLIGLTAVRFNLPAFHGRWVPRAAMIPVFPLIFAVIVVLGLAISGPRRIPDTLATLCLPLVSIAVVVALLLDASLRWRGTASWIRLAVEVAIASLIAAWLIWTGISNWDFLS